jgi:serine/threonine-protein kinase HipA
MLSIISTAAGAVGTFTYGKSYLSNAAAIPLDPVSLPLQGVIQPLTHLQGYPGVVLDACPDRWGIKAITRLRGEQTFPTGYLLLNDPGRSGCLAFSETALQPPSELESREFPLTELLRAAAAIEENIPVNPELIKALHPGTGGARPKCNVIDDDAAWIAKFPSVKDSPLVSIPRLEHATMTLAKVCGINVAETRIVAVDHKDICLVRRFDRVVSNGEITRLGFLSARTVFYDDPSFAQFGNGSYPRLARWLARFGGKRGDASELYRRMVFNCAVRNTDDHELNHGLIYDPASGGYVVSPAYDVLPQIQSTKVCQHALLIGDSATGTIENLLSAHISFGLDRVDAVEIIKIVTATIRDHWHEVFYECGFGDDGMRHVAPCFRPLPVD